ncbi:MAG TPA: hypothetical protein VK433_11860 [Stellaceae bacterium]|nr:hypothetical protein [Stellaceae bacterium]
MAQQANLIPASQYRAAVGDIEAFAETVADPRKRRALQRLASHYLGLVASLGTESVTPTPAS